MMHRLSLVVALSCLVACGGAWAPLSPIRGEVSVLDEAEVLAFRQRIHVFYQRLLKRRFNTLETFNDPILRDYFRSVDLFFDYYASLAEDLAETNFEKSRPTSSAVLDFIFDRPDRARVLVRFVGEDGRPMRFGAVVFDRVDVWELADGVWWVTPNRL